MNEYNLKRLEHGRKLRESTTLIKCRAIVDFDDGSNWQWVHADILPKAINSEGYVEEVWIASESVFIDKQEVNGETYLLLYPNWLQVRNITKIDRFEIDGQEPSLIPSPNLVVRYRINKQQLS